MLGKVLCQQQSRRHNPTFQARTPSKRCCPQEMPVSQNCRPENTSHLGLNNHRSLGNKFTCNMFTAGQWGTRPTGDNLHVYPPWWMYKWTLLEPVSDQIYGQFLFWYIYINLVFLTNPHLLRWTDQTGTDDT